MLNQKSIWVSRIVRVNDGQYVTISNPKGNKRISLIFMHLPDGNMKGDGFKNTGNNSLEKLNNGKIKRISSIDKQSSYTKDELITDLVKNILDLSTIGV
jgi:hypothetical protein